MFLRKEYNSLFTKKFNQLLQLIIQKEIQQVFHQNI